jgi:ERCC4-related helicase
VEKLVNTLLEEKAFFEGLPTKMEYRGLIFVTRRDAALVLTELLARHPRTAHVFRVGCLLGESGNFRRHSFLDITRRLLRQPASETLKDFRIGNLDLIVATAVAEEGLDIQECCNVVRWDAPANMVSWAQSRGRARQKRSSFVLMLSDSRAFEKTVHKWEELEKKMAELYKNRGQHDSEYQPIDGEDEKDGLRFTVGTTG